MNKECTIKTSIKRIDYLRNTPQKILQSEMVQRLNLALAAIPPNTRQSQLALQILELRLKKPAVLTAKWRETIELWYKLVKIAPAISHILSEYDREFQEKQILLMIAMNGDFKAAQ